MPRGAARPGGSPAGGHPDNRAPPPRSAAALPKGRARGGGWAWGREPLSTGAARGLGGGTGAPANLRPEFIERSATTSLLKKPADKEDCADMVVTMCRTETMTGQTVVIDSGRYFH